MSEPPPYNVLTCGATSGEQGGDWRKHVWHRSFCPNPLEHPDTYRTHHLLTMDREVQSLCVSCMRVCVRAVHY